MGYVWTESLRQTQQLIETWISSSSSGIRSVAKDTRALSLNVLAAIGFHRSFSSRKEDDSGAKRDGATYSYRDALQIVLENVVVLMLLPPRHLIYSWLPTSLREIGTAARDYKTHMVKMVDEENKLLNRGEKGTGSLMTSFIRALDARARDSGVGHAQGLSVDEIFGNIFVINFAGHDTTANTLAFTMFLLAMHPDVQEWVGKEINDVVQDTDCSDRDYVELFPRLVRCRAVLVSDIHLVAQLSVIS